MEEPLLSGQLDPPALSCPFTQPICEACLRIKIIMVRLVGFSTMACQGAVLVFLDQVHRPPRQSIIPTPHPADIVMT